MMSKLPYTPSAAGAAGAVETNETGLKTGIKPTLSGVNRT